MKNNDKRGNSLRPMTLSEALSQFDWKTIISCVLGTILVFGIYRYFMGFPNFEIVLLIYFAITAGLLFAYFIYNRGMSRKNITVEMLPDSWSEEKKQDFVEEAKTRQKKSKWLIVAVLPFIITFFIDAIELYVWEPLKSLLF